MSIPLPATVAVTANAAHEKALAAFKLKCADQPFPALTTRETPQSVKHAAFSSLK